MGKQTTDEAISSVMRPTVKLRDIESDKGLPVPEGQEGEAGRYKVLGLLGQGGVGTVHRGHDSDLGRDVAMKFLHKRYAKEPSVLHRFVEEAQIGGQLQHPGIVPVYELGIADGKPFFAMKMVKGETLAKKLSERVDASADRRKFLAIFEDVCQTMAYAHARGVVHRDLKPANIMIGSFGEVQIVDWGMGKVLQSGGVADEQRSVERQSMISVIETARSSGHGTQSVMGSVMGTPAYMPPEQARGDVDAMDERSDVFSLGAILCEILTGQPPYIGDSSEMIGMAAMAKLEGAEQRLAACGAEEDLVDLVRLCLMPSPAARPQSAGLVAKAVLKHLAAAEERVHAAMMRSVSLRRTQKLGVALIAVFAVGLTASLWFWGAAVLARGEADEQAELAGEQRANAIELRNHADTERGKAEKLRAVAVASQGEAQKSIDNFTRLSFAVRLERSKATEGDLYPAWPSKAQAMQDWLKDAKALYEERDALHATIATLRADALPLTAAELAQQHPAATPLRVARERLASLVAANAVRAGGPPPEPFALQEGLPRTAAQLTGMAAQLSGVDRAIIGREREGLALARRAVAAKHAHPGERLFARMTLAWSLFANGLDDEAIDEYAAAVAQYPGKPLIFVDDGLLRLRDEVAKASSPQAAAELAALKNKVAALEAAVEKRWQWRFEKDSTKFLHDTLTALVADVEDLADTIASVERRLRWAESVEKLTIINYEDKWAEARDAIEAANGESASKLYAAHPLQLKPQMGLVPIGRNPVSLLWEFYHLRSAWDGVSEPDSIPIPTHQQDGTIQVAGDTGIVFVLLPGGVFTMGAQTEDPKLGNYDAIARFNTPVRDVSVKPFFLARHELTQGQWSRLWTGSSAGRLPSFFRPGHVRGLQRITLAHPVEYINWNDSSELLRQQQLSLPTEEQWEYGCRNFTTTPWICDRADLKHYANFMDQTVKRTNTRNPERAEAWNDGHLGHAPVGSFDASPFGLHDMHGNLFEMTSTPADATHGSSGGAVSHISRGGSWAFTADSGRAHVRRTDKPVGRDPNLGVRAMRELDG